MKKGNLSVFHPWLKKLLYLPCRRGRAMLAWPIPGHRGRYRATAAGHVHPHMPASAAENSARGPFPLGTTIAAQ